MNVRKMEYFNAIAEFGNISEAARFLNVSQPALSNYLSGLEHELGKELFKSEKKRLVLTEAGQIYAQAAKTIVEIKESTYKRMEEVLLPKSQQIRIASTPSRGAVLLVDAGNEFRKSYPNIEYVQIEGEKQALNRMLLAGEFDFY